MSTHAEQTRELARYKQRRYFAQSNQTENENGYKRYIAEITKGTDVPTTREIVKDAYKWGDRRLDRVLETRAGAFSPKTASELEARTLVHVQKVRDAIDTLCRYCDDQLDQIDDLKAEDAEWFDVKLIEQTGGKFAGTKIERMPIAQAERALLEARLDYERQFGEMLKAFKVDTIININTADISQYTPEELEQMYVQGKQAQETKKRQEVVPDYDVSN